ncbi:MAG: DUF218 domain-containing protein [Clostridiales bacterium]|nr:DUF218 domain-containing protein [Clostridiales bacterium]
MIRILWRIVNIIVLAAVLIIGGSIFVVARTSDQIAATFDSTDYQLSGEEAADLKTIEPECIMVLGASVKSDGTPSSILQDRLDVALSLYKEGIAPKILLTGDNGQVEYNEVNVMRSYMEGKGVPPEDIFLDHAGFSTYESVYRAGYIFEIKKMIVVTQKYHLYRSLYGCESMGIEALGVASDQKSYEDAAGREIREILARDKDMVKWIIKPEPTYLGGAFPINGNGITTH